MNTCWLNARSLVLALALLAVPVFGQGSIHIPYLLPTGLYDVGSYEDNIPVRANATHGIRLLFTLQGDEAPAVLLYVWRFDPNINDIRSEEATGVVTFGAHRRISITFSEHGIFRGRISADGGVIGGRLHTHGFTVVKHFNHAVKLTYAAPPLPVSGGGYGGYTGGVIIQGPANLWNHPPITVVY